MRACVRASVEDTYIESQKKDENTFKSLNLFNLKISTFSFLSWGIIVNWITMTRKYGEHLRTTYGNIGQLFRSY